MGSLAPSSNCGVYTETIFLTIYLERNYYGRYMGRNAYK